MPALQYTICAQPGHALVLAIFNHFNRRPAGPAEVDLALTDRRSLVNCGPQVKRPHPSKKLVVDPAAPNTEDESSSVRTNVSVEASALPQKGEPQPTLIFPEGGLRAWSTVAGAFLVQFCGFGYTTSFGVYQDFYTRDYLNQSSSSSIAWIGSINAFIIISGGLVSGRFFDRGYFYPLVITGSLLQSFSLFMLSLCKREQLWQIFLAQGLGMGIGAGTLYVPSVAVVSHYFQKRRALAMSIVASGSSLGAVMHPIMLNNTFQRLGFGNAVRASAGLISGLLLIACLLMRPRLPPAATHPPFWRSLPRFARDTPYLFAVFGMAAFSIGLYFPLFYLQLDAITHGLSENLSFYSLVILNFASFVGRLSPGLFVRRFGVLNMLTGAAGCGAVLILCMIALKTIASVVVIGVLYGFFAGVFITLMAPLLAVLTTDMGELGLRMGVGFGVAGIGGLVGPPINGALLTSTYIWWRPALFSGLMAFLGFGFFCAMRVAVRVREKASAQHQGRTGEESKEKDDSAA
ncbi:major facilitator superfamily domain-containing protein [Mycena metata]|uniref:Major facilitator superfamily domain-containing protein n=1 Tax=Mycena metata TaxID=1033252 RepID=A0AAD7NY67_9AGAR|nr:major facilitator superfamily domain-containing protein [Mycena metata]